MKTHAKLWKMTLGALAVSLLFAGFGSAQPAAKKAPPSEVTFYGNPSSPIAGGVVIPPGRAMVWTSGTVPGVANESAERGSRDRFGDTYTQAKSVLGRIEAQLVEQGLGMKDVVYLRAYLVPDKEKGGTLDMEGWSKAYGEAFGNEKNPTKPARSTVGVAALVAPEWLIEIEAFAVFPQ